MAKLKPSLLKESFIEQNKAGQSLMNTNRGVMTCNSHFIAFLNKIKLIQLPVSRHSAD